VTQGATIYDVARRADVSISTVSLALNSPARVKPTTLDRVLEAIDALGYVPKTEAVSRARRGVGRIGVIAPFTSFPSFARRLNGVLRAVSGEPYEIVVFDQESAASSRLVTLPLTRRVDGLIVMSIPVGPEVSARLKSQSIPTVLVELAHPEFTSIAIDNEAGGRLVADLLVARGHRHVGFIGHATTIGGWVSQSDARLQGLRAGLYDAGVPLNELAVRRVEHRLDAAQKAATDLLAGGSPPTAIFAYDDVFAAGVLTAASRLGVAVPDELAVVGFDDSELAESLDLTSVKQPLEESGEFATRALLASLSNPGRTVAHTHLQLTLVERGSTRRANDRETTAKR
jgi:DNA-binding LacI/PurR family transcriptional regulator